jgi:acyl-coenzyme A thioesterase PaaI-like protein
VNFNDPDEVHRVPRVPRQDAGDVQSRRRDHGQRSRPTVALAGGAVARRADHAFALALACFRSTRAFYECEGEIPRLSHLRRHNQMAR